MEHRQRPDRVVAVADAAFGVGLAQQVVAAVADGPVAGAVVGEQVPGEAPGGRGVGLSRAASLAVGMRIFRPIRIAGSSPQRTASYVPGDSSRGRGQLVWGLRCR